MNRQRTILISVVIAGLAVVAAWQCIRNVRLQVHLAFADEQINVFSEMADMVSESLSQDPPDVKAAVGYLEYTQAYYPSGTKQTQGFTLDRIVERSRSSAELRIIEMLSEATAKDFGTRPEAWIREFRGPAQDE